MIEGVTLTRRGWAVLGIALGGGAVGVLFGVPSVNAIIIPAGVALLIAAWQVRSVDLPPLEREAPRFGTIGERRRVRVTLADGPNRLGRIVDRVDDDLGATGNDRAVALDDGLTYEITLDDRGRHELGPTTVVMEDFLGLARQTAHYSARTSVLVRPRVHPIRTPQLERLARLADVKIERERHEFERLREYRPTDSLRDVHWKTSAKRPDVDFIVKEFVRAREGGTVVLSGEASAGGDDALADAMASVGVALAGADVRVGLSTEAGSIDPIDDPTEVDRLLDHLATVGPGDHVPRGDVHFTASDSDVAGVSVEVEQSRFTMEDLLVDGVDRPGRRVEPARQRSGVAD